MGKTSAKLKITLSILMGVLILCNLINYNLQAKEINGDQPVFDIQYIDHDPILILYDSNFTDYGFAGTGLANDPYIIEDLRINTTTSNGIEINGTTKHFIIRNCHIETDGKGILIRYAGNGTVVVENNHMVGNDADAIVVSYTDYSIIANNTGVGDHTGVRINVSNNPLVYNNSFLGGNPSGYITASGTHLSNVNNAEVYNNTFDDFNRGIYVLDGYNCVIINNTCLNTKEYGAIYLSYTEQSHVINNTVTNSIVYDGIRLWESSENEITYNTISDCDDYGINLQFGSRNNTIYHNNLYDNHIGSSQGYDSSALNNNTWYNEILKEGNFWNDYTSPGVYVISGSSGTYDYFPLNNPIYYGENYTGEIFVDDIYEENDDFYAAKSIIINTTHSLYAWDNDYFVLDLIHTQHIELVLDFNDTAVDLDLYLCDYTGEVVAFSEGYTSPEIINHNCIYTGIYFIVVTYYSGVLGLQYDLFIEVTTSPFQDDGYEDNDYLDEAATLPDEGIFNLFYADIDLFNITLSPDYTYTFTMSFNAQIIDLDMYLLPPDFNGEEDDIAAYSNLYTSPESFTYRPGYSGVYILFILAYVENEYDPITPSSYTLTISKTLYTTDEPGTTPTPTQTSYTHVMLPLAFIVLGIIIRKRKRGK
jgi:parallel beta-helix repeat protein